MQSLRQIDIRNLYRNYRKVSKKLNCFFRSTPFVSLKHYPDFIISNNLKEVIVKNEVISNVKEDTLIIVDLPFGEALTLGYMLNKDYDASFVLSLNFMFHPYGLVGTKEDIQTLINVGLNLKQDVQNKYVFILDNNRYFQEYSTIKDVPKEKFNNQYEITYEDLPTAEILNELNIKKVFVYYRDLKEDIKSYLEYLKESSLEVITLKG
ncbi:hypothetical protein CBC_A0217 [Clostridium botulinum C str. Eklund]|nr:hypothetical protein CBC_A0217 [Clostridium botulinum C str. Eklund]NEZ49683.1 normocyte-binding protein [Clostridium botulinum]